VQGQINYKVTFSSQPRIEEKRCVDTNTYHQLFVDETVQTSIEGYPSMPVKYINFLLPPNTKVTTIAVNSSLKQQLYLDYKIMPAQKPIPIGSGNDSVNFIDASKYSLISVYPETLAEVVGNNYFRGAHLITVAVYPCQYYPEEDKLKCYEWVDITLNYTSDTKQVFIPQWTDDFKKTLEYIIVNKQTIEEYSSLENSADTLKSGSTRSGISTNGAEYVIVTSAALAPAFNDFIAWKIRKGIKVKLVTIEDVYANYTGYLISDIYDNA
jgi:hypothetical protein